MADMKDSDYSRAKRVCKDFEMKNVSNNHGLYLKSDTLLLAGVFESVRRMCLEIFDLDPAKCFSAPGLAWKAALKKD